MSEVKAITKPKFDTPQAVIQNPKQLREQMQQDKEIRAVINEYIADNMVAGKDYGSIDIRGHKSKPSLFKPGAEKFCGLFKIRPTFKRDDETVEMLGNTPGILAYICELVDSQGRVIGEGRGTAKTDPKGGDFDINKQVKIAQKRAQVDAVLRTGGLSDFFTQDMEDAPVDSAKKPCYATMKQLELMINRVKWGLKEYDPDEIRGFLDKVLGHPFQETLIGDVDEALNKIDAAIKEDKIQTSMAEKPEVEDVVVDLDPDEEINLDDIPY